VKQQYSAINNNKRKKKENRTTEAEKNCCCNYLDSTPPMRVEINYFIRCRIQDQ
jgi:hypothetical protein